MTPVRPLLFLVFAVWLAAPALSQPTKSVALEKAKAKFEADTAKAEEAFLASIDKAIAKAKAGKGDKALAEKLEYEKEQFVKQRVVPPSVPAGAYLKQRAHAVDALEAVYLPALKELVRNKKDAEAESVEGELSDLLRAARGYGAAFPDLEPKTLVLIESKGTGLVLEAPAQVKAPKSAPVSLAPKAGRKSLAQCWTVEREENGVVLRNAATGLSLYLTPRTAEEVPAVSTRQLDPARATPQAALFKLSEVRRAVTIGGAVKAQSGVLTATEKKIKGVTVHEPSIESPEDPPPPAQLWLITEAK